MRAFLLGAGATLAAVSCWSAALPARAQDSQKAPEIITLPGLEKFSLPPGNAQPRATPTPAPTPAPSPTPTPAATRTPVPPPLAPTTRQPAPAATRPAPAATATSAPTPAATPEAVPLPPPTLPQLAATAPAPLPEIVPGPLPSPEVTPAPEQSAPFPWWVVGIAVGVLALGGLALWLVARRRRRRDEIEEAPAAAAPSASPVPEPRPAPAPVPRPVPAAAPRPAPVPRPIPASVAPRAPAYAPQSLLVELRPVRAGTKGDEAQIDVEVTVTNHGDQPADEVRVVLGVVSANPAQDRAILSFHAGAPFGQSAPPFDLAPGATHRLTGRLQLFGEAINVVTVGGRTMFVPIVLVNLRWRSGLSIKTLRDAFMVGTDAADSDKLGPFWLDRGARVHDRIRARRYEPEGATAAA